MVIPASSPERTPNSTIGADLLMRDFIKTLRVPRVVGYTLTTSLFMKKHKNSHSIHRHFYLLHFLQDFVPIHGHPGTSGPSLHCATWPLAAWRRLQKQNWEPPILKAIWHCSRRIVTGGCQNTAYDTNFQGCLFPMYGSNTHKHLPVHYSMADFWKLGLGSWKTVWHMDLRKSSRN